MPVIPVSAFSTAGECFSLVRSMLNDADIPPVLTVTSTGAVRAANVVTITTALAHGLQIGSIVQVGSVSDSTFNGTQTALSVPSPNSFTYSQTGANTTSGNGTVSVLIQGDWATDAVLVPFANKAWRKLQRRMQKSGSKTTSSEVIITLPIGTTSLTDSTSPQLPIDFMAPRTIEERVTGQLYFGAPMGQVDELPSIPQQGYNRVFTWYEDGIYFIGSTSSMDIRLRYFVGFQAISDASSVMTIRGALDTVASWTAFLAATSRGALNAAIFAQQFEDDLQELLGMQAHSGQYIVGRRRPNNRGRGRNYGFGRI